ncbi:MAG: SusC/RagA family TonB-linked outer membrane protein [Clostridium sp.]|nr:SusC/RagA family TonB-linked outer membrane protein [Clostridium sp.]
MSIYQKSKSICFKALLLAGLPVAPASAVPAPPVVTPSVIPAQSTTGTDKLTVKGVVVDKETGETIIGAAVRVQGPTETGTITDMDGAFTFTVPDGSYKVTISFMGYDKKELQLTAANANDFKRIVLTPASTAIEEVVVTGIYQRKKESFTGSAATYNGIELKKIGTQNVLQSLKTLDPSFKIADNIQFGSDPNRMPDIEIRGKSSIMGLKEEYGTDPNQPLFILDGFETDIQTISDLNMNRVASVTILKDAASTAIYGSKAANGVVVIETVKPEKGRLRLSYKGDFSITMADLTDYNLMNASEKLQFEELAGMYKDRTGDALNQLTLDNLLNERRKEIARGVDTYWLSEPLRTGFTQKHNIYAEGGEEKIRYGLGLSYGNTNGVMKDSRRQTLSGNLDLIYRTGKFQFSNKLSIDYLKTTDPVVLFSEYARANPYYRKYNATGGVDKYLYAPNNAEEAPVPNPLWNAHLNNYDRGDEFGFTNNFIAEWFATNDLRARAKFGISRSNLTSEQRLSPLHTDFDSESDTEKGSFDYSGTKTFSYEGDLSVTYGHLFGETHMVNLVGGFNFSSQTRDRNGYSATGFTEDQFGAPSFANGYPTGGKPSYSESTTRAASFYLNGGYAYDNRYLLDVNYRRDGASMFGASHRFRDTWSVGLGWNIHKEKFMGDSDLFQLLKLRGSVGNPGNQNFSAYQAFTTYTFNGWMTNVFGAGVLISSLGNPDLQWQNTINYTVGADVAMLNNRLNVTLDLYRKVTDPLLAVITTPGSVGVKSVAMNAGQQKTNGLEATLRVSPIYNPQKGINWTISLNARTYKSKYAHIGNSLSDLNKAGQASVSSTTRYYDGGSPTAIWAVRSAGIDPATGKELFIKKDGNYSFDYDVNDEVVVGDTQPKMEGVLGTTFYYKGFSLGAYFRYQIGGQIFNTDLYDKVENIDLSDLNYNQDKRALYDRWSYVGQETQFKGISMVQKTERSSRFVMDENTFIGESFNVGYEFTQPFIKKAGLSSLTLQANMNDIFRVSTVKAERGIDYPFARTVSFSVSATF